MQLLNYAQKQGLKTAFFDLEQPQVLATFNAPEGDIITRLRHEGQIIFIEDCVHTRGHGNGRQDQFFQSMHEKLPPLLPDIEYRTLEADHDIFHAYYQLDGWTHYQGVNYGLIGAYLHDDLIAVLSGSDIHCAWVGWFGTENRDKAIQMGINIYVYVMTH